MKADDYFDEIKEIVSSVDKEAIVYINDESEQFRPFNESWSFSESICINVIFRGYRYAVHCMQDKRKDIEMKVILEGKA